QVRGLHAYYGQLFDAADAEKKGVLERKQAEGTPVLAALFALADRDADGRLSADEFTAFLDLHALGASGVAGLAVSDHGIGLFELLDEDGDGRLSLRELHTA